MIAIEPVADRRGVSAFHRAGREVLKPWPCARSTEDDVTRMLVGGRSAFHAHAEVRPHLIRAGGEVAGRVAFVHDRNLPGFVQAAFFEAAPGLDGVAEALRRTAAACFPGVPRLVVGLNGHLNYSCGILTNRFDEPPLFGFNWTPPHYPDCFAGMTARPMVSFRFENEGFYELATAMETAFDPGPVRVRTMDRRNLRREVAIYTHLNNASFGEHPYWSDRTPDEDFELFHPFRFLIRDENLLFAEIDGKPVGFLLWYPDFNELVTRNDESIGALDVARYRLANPIRTVRLTEIAVLPEHRRSTAVGAMILRMIQHVRRGPYRFCEGGFIFEENSSCVGMTLRYISRACGRPLEPYRRYACYEAPL